MEYWKEQYQLCMDDSDLVVIGDVENAEKLESHIGKQNWGYIKYNISVVANHVLKGEVKDKFDYTVWYEGRLDQKHEISGTSLFCLCTHENGDFFDPDGFGRAPINDELMKFAIKLSPSSSGRQLTKCSN